MPKVSIYTRATTGGSRRRYSKAHEGPPGRSSCVTKLTANEFGKVSTLAPTPSLWPAISSPETFTITPSVNSTSGLTRNRK